MYLPQCMRHEIEWSWGGQGLAEYSISVVEQYTHVKMKTFHFTAELFPCSLFQASSLACLKASGRLLTVLPEARLDPVLPVATQNLSRIHWTCMLGSRELIAIESMKCGEKTERM